LATESGVLASWGRLAATPGAPRHWPWREVLRLLDELHGLDRTAVGALLSGMVGRPASDAELGAAYDATAGNPWSRTHPGPRVLT
jgi:hypothetical protein